VEGDREMSSGNSQCGNSYSLHLAASR